MKKANHYKLIIFLAFMIGFTGTGFSQDSLFKKYQHEIGFGIQFTTGIPNRNVDYSGHAEYQLPGYNLFYRFLLSKKADVSIAFSGGVFYRKGNGYDRSGALGGGSDIYGNFEFVDFTLGISGIKRLGRHKNFNFGVGFNLGADVYQSTDKSAEKGLNPFYASLNIELSQAFKITTNYYLIVGIKQFIEANDFSSARPNLTSSLFVAYNIR